ncbi:MAG TPA: tetratricopeptide repeat protein, partial [Crenalkalicoccus sp.]|nr:tetratricopeptide repeat protein [Crenalkalicoccus sp.]
MRALLAAALLCALALPASAQMDSREAIMLQNQILELRRDLNALQNQRGLPPPVTYRNAPSAPGGDIAPELLNRILQLEEEVRRLRGQVDEQVNASRRAYEDLGKQIADLNFRLQNNPSAAPPAPAPSSPGGPANPAGPAAPSGPVRRTPEVALQQGNAALARRDYEAAEAAAREVLAAGRTTPRAVDANFLLAQSLFGQRNYQGAAVAYDDAYNRSRTGSRAPDALLGLANALTGLNERPAACATLDKLRAEFPSQRPQIRDA